MSLQKYLQFMLFIYIGVNLVDAGRFDFTNWTNVHIDTRALGDQLLKYNLTEVECSNCIETAKARWTSEKMFNYLQVERICRQKAAIKQLNGIRNRQIFFAKFDPFSKISYPYYWPFDKYEQYLSKCLDVYDIEPEWQKMLIDDLQMLEFFCINNRTCKRLFVRFYENYRDSTFTSYSHIKEALQYGDITSEYLQIEGLYRVNGFEPSQSNFELNLNDDECKKCMDSAKLRWEESVDIMRAYHLERLCRIKTISKNVHKPRSQSTLIHAIYDDITECLDKKNVTKDDQLLVRFYGIPDQFCYKKGSCKIDYDIEPTRRLDDASLIWKIKGQKICH